MTASAGDRLQRIIGSHQRLTGRHPQRACGNADNPCRAALPANDNHGSFEQMVFERAVARELSGELDF